MSGCGGEWVLGVMTESFTPVHSERMRGPLVTPATCTSVAAVLEVAVWLEELQVVQLVSAAGSVLAAAGLPLAMLMLTPDGLTVRAAGREWGRRRVVIADGGAPALACGSASMHVSALAGMCDHPTVFCSGWHL